ncbi:39S ribosomal protein L40, mitochondrial [Pararge aegeria]|uniref:Large ribosomal subunit protein mL40 n=1 Tax=Pararge aegeria aegeria TaxID=348720 RepID=A0A8S4SAT9_9NEOP|nr:39S ribosomal protein L40, mitochondrial [Pararge aegeria]CAH2245086.1 jg15924 [Pararge aegeria aegeria]
MFHSQILKQLSRLTIASASKLPFNTRHISSSAVVQFKITDQLCAEPLKKKKKVDPAIIKAREDRRRKKLEKQIRKLQKNARQLKPIEEVEPPLHLMDQMGKRKRPSVVLSAEISETRALLVKEWTRYKKQEYMANVAQIDRIMAAQKRALDMLYEESEELYNEAIMPDVQLIPCSFTGTYATPPIKNYESPDGEYIDVSKKWGHK